MEDLLQFLLGLLELVGTIADLRAMFGDGLLPWEWFGFVGASAWLIFSLGKVQWENKDWRAIGTGLALLVGGLGLLVWAGYSHYQSSLLA